MTAAKDHRATAAKSAHVPAPVERELKLRLRPQDLAPLRRRLDARVRSRTEAVDSIYLDTPDLRLARARAALRLRALGQGRRRWVQTFKTGDDGAAFSARGEWETPAPGGRLAPERLADSPLERLLVGSKGGAAAAALAQLVPVFRTRFTRTIWNITVPGGLIEVVIDDGAIEAGTARVPILEAELELKGGSADTVWKLALALATGRAGEGRLALLPYGDSKAARGFRLAAGLASRPQVSKPVPELDDARNAAVAARTVVAQQVIAQEMTALLANVEGLRSGGGAAFLLPSRGGLQTMRASLDALAVRLPPPLENGLRIWDARFGRATAPAQLQRTLDSPAFALLALRLLRWSSAATATTTAR